MPNEDNEQSVQHIGNTILVVMMEVEPEGEEAFERWYNDEPLPERLEIIDAMPRTPSGKIQKFHLREKAAGLRAN